MSRPTVEVADVIKLAGNRFLKTFAACATSHHRRILGNLVRCRTAALGGHVVRCGDCHYEQVAYNSCRDRHCPKCQAAARAHWMEARSNELLPVPYFHLVFTVPHQLSSLMLQNKKTVYDILFKTTAETLKQVAANPKHLGAQVGFLAVLHTWGQNLMHHPHLHCVIPAGGLSPDCSQWIASRKKFFLPIRILSQVFRGKFIHFLKQAFQRGQLEFHGQLNTLSDDHVFEKFLNRIVRRNWVVYAKAPFGGPEQVLKYLARYTHRVAISNSRILRCDEQSVTFRWKNYAAGGQQQTMTLDAVEFLRRFLMHSLPSGFQRIRHFGFLANRQRCKMIAQCRELLGQTDPRKIPGGSHAPNDVDASFAERPPATCKQCGSRRIERIEVRLHGPVITIQKPNLTIATTSVALSDTS